MRTAAVPLSALLCVLHKKKPIVLHISYKPGWAGAGAFCRLRLGAGDRGPACRGTRHPQVSRPISLMLHCKFISPRRVNRYIGAPRVHG